MVYELKVYVFVKVFVIHDSTIVVIVMVFLDHGSNALVIVTVFGVHDSRLLSRKLVCPQFVSPDLRKPQFGRGTKRVSGAVPASLQQR